MTIADSVSEQARKRPDHPALIEGGRVVSYGELDELVRRTASHLAALDARPGDRIGLCLHDTIDHLAAMVAVVRMGGTIVPIDWRAKEAEKALLAARFDMKLIVAEPGLPPTGSSNVVELDEAWHRAVRDAARFEDVPIDADDPMIINLSSGTTAASKGAVATHRQYALRLEHYRANYGSFAGLRYLSVTPLCFSAGRNYSLAHLHHGGTAVIHPSIFTPAEYPELIAKHRITSAFVVPTVLRWLLDLPVRQEWLLPGVRCLISGADRILPEEKIAAAGRLCPNFFESYSTAMTGQLSCLHPADLPKRAASDGRINKTVEIEVVDPDDRPVPAGEAGRLRCRGACVSVAFYPSEAAMEGQGFRDGWFYTGDLARIDTEGYLYLTGREADLIVRRGVTLHPGEVEGVLREHPAVGEAVVVARPDGAGETSMVAVVVAKGTLDPADLRRFWRGRLTAYKQPDAVVVVDDLPRTSGGKIKRGEVARMVARTDAS